MRCQAAVIASARGQGDWILRRRFRPPRTRRAGFEDWSGGSWPWAADRGIHYCPTG
jgi:hypothetical protein